MEQLLRGGEIPEIDPYDLAGPVLYIPVRHHSPACAYHLKKAIAAYEPDCILIEGPENAMDQIPVLSHPDTKAPAALYYFYKDKKGLLGEKKEDYRCYYPFLDCSPELVALREARMLSIPAFFMDLSYGEILLGTAEGRGIRQESKKQSYNDDYLLSRSRYMTLLCEKTGMRDFEEFWEKYFEIGGLALETGRFVEQMFRYCCLCRVHTPREEMEADGCLFRERHMARRIAEAAETYDRILVVTGGFHTWGLMELLDKDAQGRPVFTGEPVEPHRIPKDDQGVYPLAYSMEAADALNGYASGMPSPGFYQQVWEELDRRDTVDGAYEEAVLHQLVHTGRQARKKKEALSSYDVICALSMAKGLAALRGKREPGLYELQDAALSSFVKGERNLSTDQPLRILKRLNTGKQVGGLCADALRPPLLEDFEEQCRTFGFQIQSSVRREVVLELFTKKKHLAASRFLYQMEFLNTGFGKRKKGADLVGNRDRNRVREIWSYQLGSGVLSALVDVSMSGGTVREAARERLLRSSRESTYAKEAAELLAKGFLMGFLEEQRGLYPHVRQVLAEDGDYFSLAGCFSHLQMLYEVQTLYETDVRLELEELIGICFQKLVQLLPSMAQVPKEQLTDCMKSFLDLYQLTGRAHFSHGRPMLTEAFLRLLEQKDVQPGLEGTALGLLYGADQRYEERIRRTAAGYLKGTEERRLQSAVFLRGLFYTARDMIFVQDSFLTMIDELLGRLSAEEFLMLLPELRQAFGYFTPLEIDRIAGRAAALHGAGKNVILKGHAVSPLEYEYGERLDQYVLERMEPECRRIIRDN